LHEAIPNAQILIVRSATKVTAALLQDAPNLRLIIRAGVGLDNIDIDACKAKNIEVKNTPNASTNAVAELAICMLIGSMRKVGYLHAKMAEGEWAKKEGTGQEIHGKTLGIIGMGRIGQAVAQKAKALGMNVIYHDREGKNLPDFKFIQSIDELLSSSDAISLHAAAPKNAPPILSQKEFSKCKKGAYLLNLARGSLIDESALIDALKSGQIAAAALDVYPSEPYEGELCILENVLLTPHIGASTLEAQLKIADEIVQIIKG
ncbi:MAG: NAD(P)-dependent oxidoreductase, partial [Candidatus Micrarchaeota archaeon]